MVDTNSSSADLTNKGEKNDFLIEVNDLNFSYGKDLILEGINFSVSPNQLVAVLGTNGAGKSTLIKCLNKIHKPASGSVKITNINLDDMTISELAKKVAYVPQTVSTGFPMDVFDVVLLGRRPFINWRVGPYDKEKAVDVIKRLNLEEFIFRKFHTLSGGEQQRVIIAKAMTQDPVLYLFDEPTSNLDLKGQYEVLEEIKKMVSHNLQKCSAIVAMHDINLAAKFADKIIILHQNSIYCYSRPYIALNCETIAHVYGVNAEVSYPGHPKIPFINVLGPIKEEE